MSSYLSKMAFDASYPQPTRNLPVPYNSSARYKTGSVGRELAFRHSTQSAIAGAGRIVPAVGLALIGVDIASKYVKDKYEDILTAHPELLKPVDNVDTKSLEKFVPLTKEPNKPLPETLKNQELLYNPDSPTLLGVLALGNVALVRIAEQISHSIVMNEQLVNATKGVGNQVTKISDTMSDYGTANIGLTASIIEQLTYLSEHTEKISDKAITATDLKIQDIVNAIFTSGQAIANSTVSSGQAIADSNITSGQIVSDTLSAIPYDDLGVNIHRSDEEKALTTSQLAESTFNTTEIQLQNLEDGIPSATPQMLQALKNATTAQKNSELNNFELDESDADLIFSMPDLGDLFTLDRKSERVIAGLS